MLPAHLKRNEDELSIIRGIAGSADDGAVLMLNLNRYLPDADFPEGDLYRRYMSGLETLLRAVGARILWRLPVFGQAVGNQRIDEVVAAWYPTHRAFLDLQAAPGAAENYRLRGLSVEHAVIQRWPGDRSAVVARNEGD